MSRKTYVIADLHGRFDLLQLALAEIERRAAGTVVFTGDYVDRGPASRQVIERLMGGPFNGWRWICLKGNHEDIMSIACREPTKISWWLRNGGGATLMSYGQKEGDIAKPSVVPKKHLDWFERLPLYHQDAHRIYVHAGVDPTIALSEQIERDLLWMLYPDRCDIGLGDLHVVHGHHQFEDGPLLYRMRTDLDTGAFYSDRLVVGVFDDGTPGGPVELIEVTPQGARSVSPEGFRLYADAAA